MAGRRELRETLAASFDGDPWHGASVASLLEGIPASVAHTPPPAGHTIRELLDHMTAWTGEVASRLDGHPPKEPEGGEWPSAADRDFMQVMLEADGYLYLDVARRPEGLEPVLHRVESDGRLSDETARDDVPVAVTAGAHLLWFVRSNCGA